MQISAADPGFPWGGAPTPQGERQHTILPNFPKNCMKSKEFGHPGGVHALHAPPKSATEYLHSIYIFFILFISKRVWIHYGELITVKIQ